MSIPDNCDVIILAGGLGTRLREVVPDLPKPMAPVAGRPFLAHILDRLSQHGAKRVILAVGYMSEAIKTCFASNYSGMELVYATEPEPLGTGGAIAYASAFSKANDLIILNGDTFLELDYGAFIADMRKRDAKVGIVVRSVSDVSRYGCCKVSNGHLLNFSEKGSSGEGLINGGVYYIKRDLFSLDNTIPDKFSFENDYMPLALATVKPSAYVCSGYFIDIGIPDDFARAQTDFSTGIVHACST